LVFGGVSLAVNESRMLTVHTDCNIGYEELKPYPMTIGSAGCKLPDTAYSVGRTRHAKIKVNGKSSLDWVVESRCVKTDKDSGIVNNAEDWAVETMENANLRLWRSSGDCRGWRTDDKINCALLRIETSEVFNSRGFLWLSSLGIPTRSRRCI
jgi:hypothetical protein